MDEMIIKSCGIGMLIAIGVLVFGMLGDTDTKRQRWCAAISLYGMIIAGIVVLAIL